MTYTNQTPPAEEDSDRRVRSAMQTQANIDSAEVIGTPYGLRSLFPSNIVASRTRQIQPAEIQRRRIIMKQNSKREDDQNRSAPTGTAQATERLQRDGEGTRGQPDTDHTDAMGTQERPRGSPYPNAAGDAPGRPGGPIGGADGPLSPILPTANTPPGPIEQEGGALPGKVVDPGPPPTIPTYNGPTSNAANQLLSAATAHDVDAVRAIPTRNEPPQVGQYKANLLQWLDDVEDHKRNSDAMRNAQAGTNPDDEAQLS